MRRIAIQIVEHLSTREAFYFIFTAMHFSIIFISIFLLRFFVDFVHFISIYILSDFPAGQRPAKEGMQAGRPGRLISLRSFLAFVVTRNWYFMAVLISAALKEEHEEEG